MGYYLRDFLRLSFSQFLGGLEKLFFFCGFREMPLVRFLRQEASCALKSSLVQLSPHTAGCLLTGDLKGSALQQFSLCIDPGLLLSKPTAATSRSGLQGSAAAAAEPCARGQASGNSPGGRGQGSGAGRGRPHPLSFSDRCTPAAPRSTATANEPRGVYRAGRAGHSPRGPPL